MLGQIGSDHEGKDYKEYLKSVGVDVDSIIEAREGVKTGQAYIMSLPSGDNSIFIFGGANMEF